MQRTKRTTYQKPFCQAPLACSPTAIEAKIDRSICMSAHLGLVLHGFSPVVTPPLCSYFQ